MAFVDFDICHSMPSLRKLYSVTLTYFSKVKNSYRDLATAANAHSSVTSASTAVFRVELPSQTQDYPQQQMSIQM